MAFRAQGLFIMSGLQGSRTIHNVLLMCYAPIHIKFQGCFIGHSGTLWSNTFWCNSNIIWEGTLIVTWMGWVGFLTVKIVYIRNTLVCLLGARDTLHWQVHHMLTPGRSLNWCKSWVRAVSHFIRALVRYTIHLGRFVKDIRQLKLLQVVFEGVVPV